MLGTASRNKCTFHLNKLSAASCYLPPVGQHYQAILLAARVIKTRILQLFAVCVCACIYFLCVKGWAGSKGKQVYESRKYIRDRQPQEHQPSLIRFPTSSTTTNYAENATELRDMISQTRLQSWIRYVLTLWWKSKQRGILEDSCVFSSCFWYPL